MASNVDIWIERLKKAFKGWGTDEDEVYSVLQEAQGQIASLVSSYPELEDQIYDEFSKKELQRALLLFYEVNPLSSAGPLDNPQWVTRLHDAFNAGILGGVFGGTDEDAVYDVLQQALDAGQMEELAIVYAQQYPGELSLEDELYDEFSKKELKKALQLYYRGLGRNTAPVVARISIDGTLVPSDSAIPFVPKYPFSGNAIIWIYIDITPEEAKATTDILHLFSKSGSYKRKHRICDSFTIDDDDTSEIVSRDISNILIGFSDVSIESSEVYTLEVIPENGLSYKVFYNLSYDKICEDYLLNEQAAV